MRRPRQEWHLKWVFFKMMILRLVARQRVGNSFLVHDDRKFFFRLEEMRVAATKALTFVLERTRKDAASGSNLRYTLDDLDAGTGSSSSSSSSAGVGSFDDMADFSFPENFYYK